MTSPAGKLDSMKVKMMGINWNILACTGSGGGGFSFCCKNIVTPMISGHTPRCSRWEYWVGATGLGPKRLKMLVGSTADRSRIQPKKGACRISIVTKITLYNEKKTG